MSDKPRLSFCITCKGRLHHLSETLPHNLRVTQGMSGVEFVVLDYDSSDGLEGWMREHMAAPMREGRVRYAKHEPAPYFKMAHAKNMAHRLGAGDVLCNLDADNYLVQGFPEWLQHQFERTPNIVVSSWSDNPLKQLGAELRYRYIEKGKSRNGGLIAVTRKDFDALRGYDEAKFEGWGPDDIDFSVRAQKSGLRQVKVPARLRADVIRHSSAVRVEHMRPEIADISLRLANRSPAEKLPRILWFVADPYRKMCANPNSYGEGSLRDMKAEDPAIGIDVASGALQAGRGTSWADRLGDQAPFIRDKIERS